mgnify:FL=1
MAERPFFRKVFQMRHPIQGNRLHLQYRVETPYKNGYLDHLFADKAQAFEYADKTAAEFGLAMLFDHLTNEVMHVSYHLGQMNKNMKQFDLRGNLKFKTLPISNNWLDKEVAQ